MKKEIKIYGLEAINSSNLKDRTTVKIKNKDGVYENKTTLSNIDKTVIHYFKSKEQFLYYLKQKGIIDKRFDDIKIVYKHVGYQTIELEFNNELLKHVAENSLYDVNIEAVRPEFELVLNEFIKMCKDNNFYNLVSSGKTIPQHLKERANQLNKFIDSGNNEDYGEFSRIRESISNMLKSYKTFRTIFIYINSYKNNKEIVQPSYLPGISKEQVDGQISLPNLQQEKEEIEGVYTKEEFMTREEMNEAYNGGTPYMGR